MEPHWPYNHHYSNNNNNNNLPISFSIQTTPLTLPPQPTHQDNNNNLLKQQLRNFWEKQQHECKRAIDFRNNSLPLARIKKIMKTDEDVRMISAEAPVLLSKACEMFIVELTLRSWNCTEESKRRTLQKSDISSALSTTDLFDFLVDIVPRDQRSSEKPIVGPASLLPPSAASTSTAGQGFYCPEEGVGLNMGMQMMNQMDDHHHHHDGGNMEGGWPFHICDDNQPAWPPMHGHPSQF